MDSVYQSHPENGTDSVDAENASVSERREYCAVNHDLVWCKRYKIGANWYKLIWYKWHADTTLGRSIPNPFSATKRWCCPSAVGTIIVAEAHVSTTGQNGWGENGPPSVCTATMNTYNGLGLADVPLFDVDAL